MLKRELLKLEKWPCETGQAGTHWFANLSRNLGNMMWNRVRHNVNTAVSSYSVGNVYFWNVFNKNDGNILQIAPLIHARLIRLQKSLSLRMKNRTNLMLLWKELLKLLQHLYIKPTAVPITNHRNKVLICAAQRKWKILSCKIDTLYVYIISIQIIWFLTIWTALGICSNSSFSWGQ